MKIICLVFFTHFSLKGNNESVRKSTRLRLIFNLHQVFIKKLVFIIFFIKQISNMQKSENSWI
jgi:hypothetical protein